MYAALVGMLRKIHLQFVFIWLFQIKLRAMYNVLLTDLEYNKQYAVKSQLVDTTQCSFGDVNYDS